MPWTRPDLAFAISVVSHYVSNPIEAHRSAVKRIFRCIKSTLDLQLTYRESLSLSAGCTDADWAGDRDTRRWTVGFVFSVSSGAISWSSRRQSTVALSSCGAEYIGQTQATKEKIWLRDLLKQLDDSTSQDPSLALVSHNDATIYALNAVVIHCDNQRSHCLGPKIQKASTYNPQWHYQREKARWQLGRTPIYPYWRPNRRKEKFLILQKGAGIRVVLSSPQPLYFRSGMDLKRKFGSTWQ